jgi:hypothetical protein
VSSPWWIAAFVVLSLAVVLTLVVVLGFLRRAIGALELAEAGLRGGAPDLGGVPPGAVVPSFDLVTEDGVVEWTVASAVGPTLLILVAPGCGPCARLLRDLPEGEIDGLPYFAVLPDTEAGRAYEVPVAVPVLYQRDNEASIALQSRFTPQAFVLDAGGFVLERLIPNSLSDLRTVSLRQKGGDLATA